MSQGVNRTEGWLFDLYPAPEGGIIVWLITRKGRPVRLCDSWRPSIYAWAKNSANITSLLRNYCLSDVETAIDYKYVSPNDFERSKVLRLTFKRSRDIGSFLRSINPTSLIETRLFNVDVPIAQLYLYEKNLFPLAFVRAHTKGDDISWELLDDPDSCQYEIPPMKGTSITLHVRKSGKVPTFNDPLESITIKAPSSVSEIDSGSETDKLLELVRLVKEIDPDVILTKNGDVFVFPYLIQRAFQSQVLSRFILDREGRHLQQPRERGKSYFSYGQIYYRPSPVHLLGRLHLDSYNDFIFEDCGLQGLVEIARTCRTPLRRASRETIGTNMTSLQMYQAFRRDILIPWKKNEPENFKSAWELLRADRGGFILEPKIGLFDNVGEIDFASLYPTLMMKYNLTPECISCQCCAHSKTTMQVPELDYNLCEKKIGIVPHTLRILLRKRAEYKTLMTKTNDSMSRGIYDQRQAALKWALVCCLTHDSIVPVLINKQLHLVKIGELIDSIVGDGEKIYDCDQDIQVLGLGPRLEIKYSHVKRLIKTRAPTKMLEVFMDNGRRICTTANHEFFVLGNERLAVKRADQLKVGDLVPVSKAFPDPPAVNEEIDLIPALQSAIKQPEIDSWRVKGRCLKSAVWQKRKLFYRMGVPYANVRSWRNSGITPLRYLRFLSLSQEQQRQLLVGRGRRKGGRTAWIPSRIPIDQNLGFFLGLFIADGSAGRSFLRFDIGQDEPELRDYLRKATWKLFRLKVHVSKERYARMYVAQINCVTLVRVLQMVLGIEGSAERGKLVVPKHILNATKEAVLGFILGLIAGDGSVHRTRNIVSISSSSKNFLANVSYLLLRVKLQHAFRAQYRKRFNMYRLDIIDPSGFPNLMELGFLKKTHQQRLTRIISTTCAIDCHHITYEMFPVVQSNMRKLARRLRTIRDPRIDKALRICPDRARRMLRKLVARNAHRRFAATYEFLEKLVSAEIGFVSIKEIKEAPAASRFVYCFELEDGFPGFFAGNGAVLTHNSFGYLGYKHARFGKIDAHIGVCAFARKILRQTVEIAQEHGFSVVHGIVDSVWLTKKNASEGDYLDVRDAIEERLGLPASFEGVYRWIVFLPSKVHADLPVLNRYYGVFKNGKIKVRGIEYRRRDTPPIIRQCQHDLINYLAPARNREEFITRLPGALRLVRGYVDRLRDGRVDIEELMITKQLSKDPAEYEHNVMQAIAAKQLAHEGVQISAGQNVSYIIQRGYGVLENCVLPSELIDGPIRYDVEKYTQLLLDAVRSILSPPIWNESPDVHDAELLRA